MLWKDKGPYAIKWNRKLSKIKKEFLGNPEKAQATLINDIIWITLKSV